MNYQNSRNINPYIRNQFRSWYIMEKYFGIVRKGGSVVFKMDLPDFIKESIKRMNELADASWEERAKLN